MLDRGGKGEGIFPSPAPGANNAKKYDQSSQPRQTPEFNRRGRGPFGQAASTTLPTSTRGAWRGGNLRLLIKIKCALNLLPLATREFFLESPFLGEALPSFPPGLVCPKSLLPLSTYGGRKACVDGCGEGGRRRKENRKAGEAFCWLAWGRGKGRLEYYRYKMSQQ